MKRKPAKKINEDNQICSIASYRDKSQAEDSVKLLRASGLKAELESEAFGKSHGRIFSPGRFLLWVWLKDTERARNILECARLFARPRKKFQMPAEEGTVEFVDMMVHDCRQYLLIAEGKIKDISEEGELELDDPTCDLFKIALRLKRLKDQCMRQAGRRPLDWQHGGGMGGPL